MRSVRDRLGALALLLTAGSPQVAHAISSTGFLENYGVYPDAVRYYAHSPAANVFLTDTGVVIDLIASTETFGRTLDALDPPSEPTTARRTGHVVQVTPTGWTRSIVPEGAPVNAAPINVFRGQDPTRWGRNLRCYGEVAILGPNGRPLYYLRTDNGLLELRAVGSAALEYSLQGVDRPTFDSESVARYATAAGEFRTQRSASLPGEVQMSWGTEAEAARGGAPTSLDWSTMLGGAADDACYALDSDPDGYIYAVGKAGGQTFPTTPGAYDTDHASDYDAYVAKLDPTGSDLQWCSFYGGEARDLGLGTLIALNRDCLVTGYSQSPDFPVTEGAYSTEHNGGADAFVLRLDHETGFPIWGSYLGGGGDDHGRTFTLDRGGLPIVVGFTASSEFPTTPGAAQDHFAGVRDMFVTKFIGNGSAIVASTLLGGTGEDVGYSSARDEDRNVIVVGYTTSVNFPTTPGVFDPSYGGDYDVVVAKLDPSLETVIYSGYLGGGGRDIGRGVAVAPDGSAWFTGETSSASFPVTPGAFDTSPNGLGDAFVTRVSADGASLVASTRLGGENLDIGWGITSPEPWRVTVVGQTSSVSFPVEPGAIQPDYRGSADGYFAEFDGMLGSLISCTYWGGEDLDFCWAVASAGDGARFVAGETTSEDFSTTSGAYDESPNGNADAFVSRLETAITSDVPTKLASPASHLHAHPSVANRSVSIGWSGSQRISEGPVTLEVIDAQGRLVRTLHSTTADAMWDLLDEARRPVSAGAYFIRLRAEGSRTSVGPARVIVVR